MAISTDGSINKDPNSSTNAVIVTPDIDGGTIDSAIIDFSGATVSMTDADNCLMSYGTWNDEVDVGTHTAHFVPWQVHMHSTSASAYDIAAMRLRVDTDGDNTGAALQVLQIRSSVSDDTASIGTMGAGLTIDKACNVDTGEVVCGGFSIAGGYKATTGSPNKVTVLQAANWNTFAGTSVNYVVDAYQNATGNTVDALLRGNVIAGTATVGLEIARTAGTLTTGIKLTGTIGTDISLQNGETISNATDGVVTISGGLRALIKEDVEAATDSLSVNQCSGGLINNYGQADNTILTLPAAAAGLNFTVILGTTVAKYFRILPYGAANDSIYLDGVTTGDDKYVQITSAVAGAAIQFVAFQTGATPDYDWYASTISGGWIAEA
jgi:hypothetical protein